MKLLDKRAIVLCAAVSVAGACTDEVDHDSLDQGLVPAGWSETDINTTGGSTAYDAGTGRLTLTTNGSAINAATDNFRFVYRPWTGDGVVVARIAGLTPGTDWSAGGVMIRQSTAANAAHASMIAFSSGKLHFRYRTSAGGSTSTSGPASGYPAPQWLKVQRVGNVFNGFVSADGQAWTPIGTANVSIGMTEPVLVGIVAFRGGTAPIDATFDGVSAMAVTPWASSDVGNVAIAGSVSQSADDYTVRAAGTGVWDVADAFRYTYRPWTGDGEIVARIDSIDAAGAANALGGVMFRESVTSPGSRHASMLVFANGKAKLRWRSGPDGATGSEGPSGGVAPPRWVRLTRAANVFTGYYGDSASGPWVGFANNSVTVAMPASLYVGFAAAREGSSALATVRVGGVATSTTSNPQRRFKVVTWNLQHSNAGATAQGDLLAGLDADVIITQETHASAATTIRGRLGAGWKVRHFAGTASEGNAVFTRLETPAGEQNNEIVGDDRLIGPSTWGGSRYATRITVRLGTTDVHVFVTHLDYPKEGSTWDTHAQNRDLFAAWLDTFAGHKIWGGDLNAKTNGNSIQIATIGAMDARGIDSCRGFFGQTHTWCNANHPTKDGGTRFDYIYKTSGMTFRSHQVLTTTSLSDHKPVISIVEVP